MGSVPMAIAVIIEFPGARRANYEKSVQLILKGRRNKLADWPAKGVLAQIAPPMPGGWRWRAVLARSAGAGPGGCRVTVVWRWGGAFTGFGKTLKPVLRRVGIQKV